MQIEFSAPDGKADAFSKAALRELIFNHGEEYWTYGSGSGTISFKNGAEERLLSLSFREESGFLLQYAAIDLTDIYVAISSSDYSRIVTIHIGGEPWEIPAAFFVSKVDAWTAADEFLSSGCRAPTLEWVRLSDQEWESNQYT